MYNYDLLGELQFWKEFLSEGKPHIILDFGGQSLVVDARLIATEVDWPEITGDQRPFTNTATELDLFTAADYARAIEESPDPEVELEGWELEHLVEIEDAEGEGS